jgi:hypothetical protein
MRAVYDEIADWYENEFLGPRETRAADPLEVDHCLRALLGTGSGTCLEIGCGTGVHATATVTGRRHRGRTRACATRSGPLTSRSPASLAPSLTLA